MIFSKDVLIIDSQAEVERICSFIIETILKRMHKKGAIVGLSGGIDSALSAALSVKAFGAENVLGIILPEKDSSKVSEEYAILHARKLGITTEKVDITGNVEQFGGYEKRNQVVKNIFPDFDPRTWKYKIVLPEDLLNKDRLNVFFLVVQLPDGSEKKKRLSPRDYLQVVAATNIKQRSRMIYLYYFAEKYNYAVIGTTNRTETLQGFFVKYGDGGVDIEPLAHLYKSQVYQLAEYLDIPKEIIDRPPTPDTYTAEVTDTEFYFSVPFHILDPFLWAYENNVAPEEVCEVLTITLEQYQRIKKNIEQKAKATWHYLEIPPALATE